jgi:hypothetical protein
VQLLLACGLPWVHLPNSTLLRPFCFLFLCCIVYAVFYEELVERPEAVAAQLLSACGLPWEPGVLKFQDTNRSVQTASMEQVCGCALREG